MQAPQTPLNEQLRLATLYALDVLESGEEERFDQYTRMACNLFKVPIALISLADSDRLVFKSQVGVGCSEMPREISFCSHTMERGELTLIEDTHLDPVFANHPMVTGEPHIRSYAGCPLFAENGSILGTLCLASPNPRKFNEHERQTMLDLADLIERELMTDHAREDRETGLLNRDGFLMIAEQTLRICNRQHMPFALIRMRLDEGDCVLRPGGAPIKKLAAVLRDAVGPIDVVGRVSTRDLAIALWNRNCDQAEELMNRIRSADRLKTPDVQQITQRGLKSVCINANREQAQDVTGMLQLAFRRMRSDTPQSTNCQTSI